jgi:hypothetical protein
VAGSTARPTKTMQASTAARSSPDATNSCGTIYDKSTANVHAAAATSGHLTLLVKMALNVAMEAGEVTTRLEAEPVLEPASNAVKTLKAVTMTLEQASTACGTDEAGRERTTAGSCSSNDARWAVVFASTVNTSVNSLSNSEDFKWGGTLALLLFERVERPRDELVASASATKLVNCGSKLARTSGVHAAEQQVSNTWRSNFIWTTAVAGVVGQESTQTPALQTST